MIAIGIDPDVDRSGIAIVDTEARMVELKSEPFAKTLALLQTYICEWSQENRVKVIIEAGWLNRSNWHLPYGVNAHKAASIGRAQGRNEQVSRGLLEWAELWAGTTERVDVVAQRPLRKCWAGKDRKITHEEICQFMPIAKGRTNQEERDAALLAWNGAGLPIRLKAKQWK